MKQIKVDDSVRPADNDLTPAQHKSEFSLFEPEPTGVHGATAVDGRSVARSSANKLSELAKEHYLFMLGPVYVLTKLKVDLLKQFREDTGFEADYGLLGVRLEWDVVSGLGPWSNVVYAVPAHYKIPLLGFLGAQILVRNPPERYEYWRLSAVAIKTVDPRGIASDPAVVDVILPSSAECGYGLSRAAAGQVAVTRRPPLQKVQQESAAYFRSCFPSYFRDGVQQDLEYFGGSR